MDWSELAGVHRAREWGIFPNEAACLRLVSAVLMEIDDNGGLAGIPDL